MALRLGPPSKLLPAGLSFVRPSSLRAFVVAFLSLISLPACNQEIVNCDVNGCSSDPCEQLCRDVTAEIRGCREEWGADWEILGATSQRDFRVSCIDQWQTERSQMEAREIDIAEEACEDAREELQSLGCVELRALYL